MSHRFAVTAVSNDDGAGRSRQLSEMRRGAEQRLLFRAVHAGHDILEITAVDGRPRELWPLVCLTCHEEEHPG